MPQQGAQAPSAARSDQVSPGTGKHRRAAGGHRGAASPGAPAGIVAARSGRSAASMSGAVRRERSRIGAAGLRRAAAAATAPRPTADRSPAAPRAPPGFLSGPGGVAEWLKAHAWKVCIRETVSRVRIPLPPPDRPPPLCARHRQPPDRIEPPRVRVEASAPWGCRRRFTVFRARPSNSSARRQNDAIGVSGRRRAFERRPSAKCRIRLGHEPVACWRMIANSRAYTVTVVANTRPDGTYRWLIHSAGGEVVARSPYAFATKVGAATSGACWLREIAAPG